MGRAVTRKATALFIKSCEYVREVFDRQKGKPLSALESCGQPAQRTLE